MESTKVIGYRDAFQTLTNRDLAQSLYDESAIIMQDVILTTDGNEHVKRSDNILNRSLLHTR